MKKERKMKKKKLKIGRIILLTALVAVVGLILFFRYQNNNMPLIVETQKATTGDISNELMTSGSVVSEEMKYYFQEVNAKVDELTVKTGDAVEKDQILVTYDTSQLESELYKLQLQQGASGADYAGTLAKDKESKIKVTDATNNINNVEPMIEFQEQHVKDLRNNLSKAQTDERKKLTDSQYQLNIQISNVQYEIANVTHTADELAALEAQLKNLNQSLQSVTNQLTTMDMKDSYLKMQKELEEQESVLAGLKTFLAEQEAIKNSSEPAVLTGYSKEQLSKNKTLTDFNVSELELDIQKAKEGIKAEFPGIVTDVQAVEGATLMSGASVLTLANAEQLKVTISLSKYDLANLKLGQEAAITINEKEYIGTVSRINRMATLNTAGAAMVSADIHIENPDDNIFLGIEAKVRIETANKKNVLLVPAAAVNTDINGDFVYVLVNGIVEKRVVKTGISSVTNIEILEGLEENEEVITTISTELQEGMQVMVLPSVETVE